MTPKEIDLVQTSFSKVLPIADAAAVLIYEHLFEIAPPAFPRGHGRPASQADVHAWDRGQRPEEL